MDLCRHASTWVPCKCGASNLIYESWWPFRSMMTVSVYDHRNVPICVTVLTCVARINAQDHQIMPFSPWSWSPAVSPNQQIEPHAHILVEKFPWLDKFHKLYCSYLQTVRKRTCPTQKPPAFPTFYIIRWLDSFQSHEVLTPHVAWCWLKVAQMPWPRKE